MKFARVYVLISFANCLHSLIYRCTTMFRSRSLMINSAFWRQAGMSYLDYLSVSSRAVRNSLKEPARSKAAARGNFQYNKTTGVAGGEKVLVSNKAA